MTQNQARAGTAGARDISRRTVFSGAAALGLGTLIACSPTAQPAGKTPPRGSAIDAAALRDAFQRTAKQMTTPGAVMLYRAPQGTLAETYGARTTSGAPPITLADHFRIGSVTKTFTGTIILQLIQEGKLRIDDPVSRYRGDVPNGDNITLAELLNMRSGLYNYSESLEFNKTLDNEPQHIWTPDELLALAFKNEPYFPPGKGWHYTNTGIILLGLIVEKVDGKSLADSYQSRLFGPLDMQETVFPQADSPAIPEPYPHGYMYGTNVSTIDSAELPAEQQAAAAAGTLKPNDVTAANPSWTWAAGGAVSTVRDLTTWVRALGDGSLLNPAWQQRRMNSLASIDPSNPKAVSYGLAIAQFGPMYGHTGELPGYQAFTGYDPATKRSLVVLSNLNSAPDGRPVAATIAQALIAKAYQ